MENSGIIHRIFSLSCDPLSDLSDKNLVLRKFHQQFLVGSNASYECKAGYVLPYLVIKFTLRKAVAVYNYIARLKDLLG